MCIIEMCKKFNCIPCGLPSGVLSSFHLPSMFNASKCVMSLSWRKVIANPSLGEETADEGLCFKTK